MPQMSLDDFRLEAVDFLSANAEERGAGGGPFRWGEGSDTVAIIEEKSAERERQTTADAKRWAALRFDAGFGWIDGPAGLGGRGLSSDHRRLYRTLEAGYRIPDQSIFTIGLGMVAPTVLAHANETVKRRYLPGLHRGDLLACQLFSEPGAGSDLASLQTSAVRDGDEWVLTGQKVWTSNAHLSDIGEIICRSDPSRPKHRSLTAFLVDMRSPGIEVRPLRQMTGGASFNEVFLDGVRVPDSHRLGDVNGGWGVAMTTLMNERASIGSGLGLGPGPGPFERLIAMARHFGAAGDPVAREALAELYIGHRVGAFTTGRALARIAAGELPGPELSIGKLAGTRHLQAMSDFVSHVLGLRLTADTGEWGTFAWGQLVCGVPGGRLGGGTDEVLKSVIAERVLGLPREPVVAPT